MKAIDIKTNIDLIIGEYGEEVEVWFQDLTLLSDFHFIKQDNNIIITPKED